MNRPQPEPPGPVPCGSGEQGFALLLVLLFTVLMYILVAELVTTARTARVVGENDALLTRMGVHQAYTLSQVEEMLLDDAAGGEEGGDGGGAGGLGGLGGMPAGGGDGGGDGAPGGAGGDGGEGEADASVDSSQDIWFEPQGFSEGDITTYVWVEDENRKLNLLTLVSPDREFADASRQRFVRLIDALREDTILDLSMSDGERIASDVVRWLEGRGRTQDLPRPDLKSDDPKRRDLTIPLQLDELLLLRSVDEDLFYDRVLDGRVIQGLESVLTVHTSLVYDPGDPDDPRRGARPENRDRPGAEGRGGEGEAPAGAGEDDAPPQPIGVGIRININTATRPVLRCLFDKREVSDLVIDAILEYRNEEVEEEEAPGLEGTAGSYTDFDIGEEVQRKIFETLEDLEEIEEFANIADPEVKSAFRELCTTESDVFTVHMASIFRVDEERRTYVMRRSRSVLVRLAGEGTDPRIHPLILLEDRDGLRVMPVDFPDRRDDVFLQRTEMDYFSREERDWNPFFNDFWLPPELRQMRGY